jgi:hypothetical protein
VGRRDVRVVAYRPGQDDRDEPATWMGFDRLKGAYDTRQCIRVLDRLGHQLGHQPVTVIWDNLGAHHAGGLQEWATTQPWLVLAYLPSYAFGVGVPPVRASRRRARARRRRAPVPSSP